MFLVFAFLLDDGVEAVLLEVLQHVEAEAERHENTRDHYITETQD